MTRCQQQVVYICMKRSKSIMLAIICLMNLSVLTLAILSADVDL